VAGRIRQEDVEAVRERTDLVKLIQGYLTLRQAGHDRLVGLCPFHTEKTASLSVSVSKQVYYCFGCAAGGDAIRFLREIESLSFTEAVERLAKDAGVSIRYEGESPAERRAASRRQALYRANEEAAALYQATLLQGAEAAPARAYLAERGISRESVDGFQVGYAPERPDFLLRSLAPRFSPEILVEAGLALKDAGGRVRDRFRGRITFPVHDLSGRAVGFGARLLPREREGADPGPKYMNSPETPVYRKGEMLYNLHRAKPTVARTGEAFVVEGYTDVIALAQAGVETAVATCGTALSEGHFQLLARFARRAVLAFDSDEAGARAAERAYGFHERFPLEAVVLVLPEGLDPAEFVRARGSEAFRTLAGESVPLVEYMIRRTLHAWDLSTAENRLRAVQGAAPIVAGLEDPVRRQEYGHMLAELAGVRRESAVLRELEKLAGGPRSSAEPETPASPRLSPQHKVEREMLKLLVKDADIHREFIGALGEDHFDRAQHRKLFALLGKNGPDVRSLVSDASDERLARLLASLAVEPLEGDLTLDYAGHVRARLEEFLLERRIDALRHRLERLNPTKHPEYDALFQELVGLERDRRQVRARAGRE
jgi:DNA primase